MIAAARNQHDVQFVAQCRMLFQEQSDSRIALVAFHTRPLILGALRSRCIGRQVYASSCSTKAAIF